MSNFKGYMQTNFKIRDKKHSELKNKKNINFYLN